MIQHLCGVHVFILSRIAKARRKSRAALQALAPRFKMTPGSSNLSASKNRLLYFKLNSAFTCAVTVTVCGVNSWFGAGVAAFAIARIAMGRGKIGRDS